MLSCVCGRGGGAAGSGRGGVRNVLPTLGASGASVREPRITGPKSNGSARHITRGGREGGRSNRARPRYQHSEHLLGGGLPSAVRSCQAAEKGASELLRA